MMGWKFWLSYGNSASSSAAKKSSTTGGARDGDTEALGELLPA